MCSGGDHSGSEGRRALEKCARVEETPHFGEGETQERGNGWLLYVVDMQIDGRIQ